MHIIMSADEEKAFAKILNTYTLTFRRVTRGKFLTLTKGVYENLEKP